MIDTPVVLLIFNRPDLTESVFNQIRKAKPKTLLIVADGPRFDKAGELEKCKQTRKITEKIDWDCKVLRNYSDVNLGCGLRISSGLDWVFEQVDRAIILEDDCLPNLDFFRFCEELLEKYYENTNITMISGNNFFSSQSKNSESYYFSCLPDIWGWATWKRAWKFYDYKMSLYPTFSESNFLDHIFSNIDEQKYWCKIFDSIFEAENKITWDYQWAFAQWINEGLSIIPRVNLVSNIGYGSSATHTKWKNKLANVPTLKLDFPLIHPVILSRNLKKDSQTLRKIYMGSLIYRVSKEIFGYFKVFLSHLNRMFMPRKIV
jgi:hypothetical protein